MNGNRKVLLFTFITLLFFSSSYIATNGQTSNFTIWLAVEDDVAEAIKTKLGTDYTYVQGNVDDVADDLNRENILGSLPDLIIGHSDAIPDLAVKNVIRPIDESRLNDVFPTIERQSSFYGVQNISKTQSIIDATSATLYGYPIGVSTTVILTNSDLIDPTQYDFDTIEGFNKAALQSNDQSNPASKIFGFSTDDVLDTGIWLYYANGGQMFSNDRLHIDNLIVNEQQSIDALAEINDLANVKKLIPQDVEATAFEQFSSTETLAMLVGDFDLYNDIKESTDSTIDISKVDIFAAAGGAELHTFNVMVSRSSPSTAGDEAKNVYDALTEKDFQTSLLDLGLIPVSESGIKGSDISDELKTQLTSAISNGLTTPIDHLWNDVEAIFENQMTKLAEGNQNHTRTALAVDIDLRILPLDKTEWGPVPTLSGDLKSDGDDSPFFFELWMGALIVGYISLRKRRNK